MKDFTFKHCPTDEMPDLPYKIKCPTCDNITAAGDDPFTSEMLKVLEGIPCSKCVAPEVYLEQLRKEKNDD